MTQARLSLLLALRRRRPRPSGPPQAGVFLEADEARQIREAVALVRAATAPGGADLRLPGRAGLLLPGRPAEPATRFNHLFAGMATPADQQEMVRQLEAVRCVVWDYPGALSSVRPGDNALLTEYIRTRFYVHGVAGPYAVLTRDPAGAELRYPPPAGRVVRVVPRWGHPRVTAGMAGGGCARGAPGGRRGSHGVHLRLRLHGRRRPDVLPARRAPGPGRAALLSRAPGSPAVPGRGRAWPRCPRATGWWSVPYRTAPPCSGRRAAGRPSARHADCRIVSVGSTAGGPRRLHGAPDGRLGDPASAERHGRPGRGRDPAPGAAPRPRRHVRARLRRGRRRPGYPRGGGTSAPRLPRLAAAPGATAPRAVHARMRRPLPHGPAAPRAPVALAAPAGATRHVGGSGAPPRPARGPAARVLPVCRLTGFSYPTGLPSRGSPWRSGPASRGTRARSLNTGLSACGVRDRAASPVASPSGHGR